MLATFWLVAVSGVVSPMKTSRSRRTAKAREVADQRESQVVDVFRGHAGPELETDDRRATDSADEGVEGLVAGAHLVLRAIRHGPPPVRLPRPLRGSDVERANARPLQRVDELVLTELPPSEFFNRHDAESPARVLPALEEDDAVAEVVQLRLPAVLEDEDDIRLARLH